LNRTGTKYKKEKGTRLLFSLLFEFENLQNIRHTISSPKSGGKQYKTNKQILVNKSCRKKFNYLMIRLHIRGLQRQTSRTTRIEVNIGPGASVLPSLVVECRHNPLDGIKLKL